MIAMLYLVNQLLMAKAGLNAFVEIPIVGILSSQFRFSPSGTYIEKHRQDRKEIWKPGNPNELRFSRGFLASLIGLPRREIQAAWSYEI